MLLNKIHNAFSSRRQSGHAILAGFGVIILIAIAATGAIAWRHHKSSSKAATTTAAATNSSANPLSAALPSGTDNASLQADLTNLNGANSADSQNLSSTNSAVNDQQNEITVPTN